MLRQRGAIKGRGALEREEEGCWSVERIRLEHRKLQTKEIVVDTCFILNFLFVSFLMDRHSYADGCACREGYNSGE